MKGSALKARRGKGAREEKVREKVRAKKKSEEEEKKVKKDKRAKESELIRCAAQAKRRPSLG